MAAETIRVFSQDLDDVAAAFVQGRALVAALVTSLGVARADVVAAFANHPDQGAEPEATIDKLLKPITDVDGALSQVASALHAIAQLYAASESGAASQLRPGNV